MWCLVWQQRNTDPVLASLHVLGPTCFMPDQSHDFALHTPNVHCTQPTCAWAHVRYAECAHAHLHARVPSMWTGTHTPFTCMQHMACPHTLYTCAGGKAVPLC